MKARRKSVVVVLGMHRSGTSAITRGLQVLGVDLGARLMPPTPGVNDKGFFEDLDVNAINVELLKAIGQDWHTLVLVPPDELVHEKHAPLRLRAIQLLRSRLQQANCFGMKDPRMCRLLPFWQQVFEHLGVSVSYVLVIRNPLSVARSLERVHELPLVKGYYLWLEHVLPSVLLTQGAARVLVDYDLLIENPQKQVVRMAQALGLNKRLSEIGLSEFSQEFLDEQLRHANFTSKDVPLDPAVPHPVATAFCLLQDVATDRVDLNAEEATVPLNSISTAMQDMAPAMEYLFRLEGQIGALAQTLGERDRQVAGLTQAVTDKDRHIGNLEQMLGERDRQVAGLTQAVTDKDRQIGSLEQMLGENAAQVLSLTEQIAALNQSLTQKEAMIQHLAASAAQFSDRLDRTRSSLGWKLFKPQRAIKKLVRRIGHRVEVHAIPFQQLKAEGSAWVATGPDPQFLLVAGRAWHGLAGWYWLEVMATSEQSLNARLCFDLGEGFDLGRAISFQLMGTGLQRVPLFVPAQCCAIRLDPCDNPARFSIAMLGLKQLRVPPELPQEFRAQSKTYEALGGKEGNVPVLRPLNEIQRHDERDYDWSSIGEDPYFVVESIGQELQPGYCRIELRIRSNLSRGKAKVYLDLGKGFSESDSMLLLFVSGETVERLYHLTAVPQCVRLDPFDCSAKFTIEHLKFTNVGPLAARQLMLEHLSNHSVQDKGESTSYILEKLQKQASSGTLGTEALLYERYNRTFKAYGIYTDWIERVEAPGLSDQAIIEQAQISFTLRPTISILMPVYNTGEIFLRKAIDSVLTQSYPNWELCIADDASPAPHVRKVLEDYARRDPRIKVMFRAENGHISAASNSALTLATGDYVALLDHDDELAPHALHFVVDAINRNPDAKIIYSDEDKIDGEGNRSDPHFKSDWNPDLFFSQNYISHLGVYRRELLEHIGGFRKGVEGSQDHDLLLRCLPHVKPSEIVHVPKVLYHWRMTEGSTALASGEKSYTAEAGITALRDFFNAQGRKDIQVEPGLAPNTYRVRYPIPDPIPLVSLLIPTRDMLAVLKPCVRSILEKTTYDNYEIIIIDNESVEPDTLEYFEHIQARDHRVRVLPYHHPFNYSAINNYGVQHARGELIGLINNDTEVISQEWLTEMVSHAVRPEIGCVGAKLYYDDNTIQHAGVIIGLGGVAGHSHKHYPREAAGYFHRLKLIQNISAVTAACLVARKDIYEQVGGLEEAGLTVAFNDVDFCLKVREAGYRNLWTPYAELYHHESKSRGSDETPEKVERFRREIEFVKSKWGDHLRSDPYYSPNLTLAREDFSLR